MQNHAESSTRRRDRKIDVTSAEVIAKMVALRNEGHSYFDISLELGLPENWTARHLKDHPEVTFKQNKGKQAVPAEVIAKMVALRNEGNTYPEIAAELGLSKHSVSKHLRNHPDVTFKSPFS